MLEEDDSLVVFNPLTASEIWPDKKGRWPYKKVDLSWGG
jgi:hypothetical protein